MTPPTLPQPTIEDSRSFYTLGQMRAHHKAWVAYALSLTNDEPKLTQPASKPTQPMDPKVAKIMNMFGMGADSLGTTDLGKAFGRKS